MRKLLVCVEIECSTRKSHSMETSNITLFWYLKNYPTFIRINTWGQIMVLFMRKFPFSASSFPAKISQLNSGFYFVTHGNMNSISWIHFKLRNEILFAELWPKTRISNKIWPMLTLRRAGGVSGTRRVEWMKTTHVSGYWTVIQSIWFDQGGGFFHATGHVL